MKKKLLAFLIVSCTLGTTVGCSTNINTENIKEGTAIEISDQEVTDYSKQPSDVSTNLDEVTSWVDLYNLKKEDYGGDKQYQSTVIEGLEVQNGVILADKSKEYGVFSTSCKDAEKFVDEKGYRDDHALEATGKVGNYDYSGRFRYPKVTQCDALRNLELTYRSDISQEIIYDDKVEGISGYVILRLGVDEYEFKRDTKSTIEGIKNYEFFDSLIAGDGSEVEVYVQKDIEDGIGHSVYVYPMGVFTIEIQRVSTEIYTKEELQEIMNNITLE